MKLYHLHIWSLTKYPIEENRAVKWKEFELYKNEYIESVLILGRGGRDAVWQYIMGLKRLNIDVKQCSDRVIKMNNSFLYIETERVKEMPYYDRGRGLIYSVDLRWTENFSYAKEDEE